MQADRDAAFETFLVEDVILTLGNLRGSLSWLDTSHARADPAIFRAGLLRLDRQIELLEERARSLRDGMTAAGAFRAGARTRPDEPPEASPGAPPGPAAAGPAPDGLAADAGQLSATCPDDPAEEADGQESEPDNIFADDPPPERRPELRGLRLFPRRAARS